MSDPIDPNIGLPNPVPGTSPGPQYASEVSAFLTALAAMGHTGSANNDGPQITTSGLDINADLPINNFNLNQVTSLRMTPLTSSPSGILDISSIYSVSGNLYFNNASGQPIQLTVGDTLNVSSIQNFNYQFINTTTALSGNTSTNFCSIDTTSGGFTITLPPANSCPFKFLTFKDITGKCAIGNGLALATSGTDTIDASSLDFFLFQPYSAVSILSDGVSNWQIYSQYKPSNSTLITTGTILYPNYVPSFVFADARSVTVSIVLPQLAALPQGTTITISDVYGQSGTHNVTISAYSGDTIKNSIVPLTLNTAYQVLRFASSSITWSVV
jgi:hypothetical protein